MPMVRPLASLAVLALAIGACNGDASPGATNQPSQGTPATVPPVTPRATATVVWPAPANPMDLTVAAGLVPETSEFLEFHVHAHLDIFVDGQPILVPAGVGINTEDPAVKRFTEADGSTSWGGIETPCSSPCISPLHTHAEFGILHTESATPTPNTLGQFFVEWDVELSETCVAEHCAPTPIAAYVDGEPYEGDPREVELTDEKVIVIVVGTPPAVIPSTYDFSNA